MTKCWPGCSCSRHKPKRSKTRSASLSALHVSGVKFGRVVGAKSNEELFVKDPSGKHSSQHRMIKERLKKLGIPYICSECKQGPEWFGKVLPIELDHADGDPSNNRLDNLRFLCPNCHSSQPTSRPYRNRVEKATVDYTDHIGMMWRRQLAFTSQVLSCLDTPLEQLEDNDRVRLTKQYLLSMHSELSEVLVNIPWKQHRYVGPSNRDMLLEELVDTQKFLFGLLQVWGVTPGELTRAFNRKSDIVEQRFKQDHLLPKQVTSDKVVIVDIDDVVANWEEGFEGWVRSQHPELENKNYDGSIDPGLRQRLKDEMHASGGMKFLELLDRSQEATSLLQAHGYTIVWLTARPIGKHPRLIGDTVAWLRDVGLPTEYIYYSDLNKHVFVVEKFPRAAALFDDKPEIVAHAKEFGIMAFEVHSYDGTQRTFVDQVEAFLQVTSPGTLMEDAGALRQD